ncbi:MAG: gas vesicle protein GvpN [Candidatus Delongbacteria bacterium]|nr:gas vesicle protein GvpN [Candidatus Delongbacteria bacterium]MCG2759652.1 gas vesicle protein GvpN [Candidatus Delongbacteria bacterium]
MEISEKIDELTSSTLRVSPKNDRVQLEQSVYFVTTPHIDQITKRAFAYLNAGFPVNFAGPAGTGKTTLAFHVASKIGRPVILIHGDDEMNSSDLVGRDSGYRKSKLIDNYIHSVVKTSEEMQSVWIDNRLTKACKNGCTLIYDEFTRSRPEANNVLLSILQEKILNLPELSRYGEGYMNVHPEFRAIFTSNPDEYVGVHKTQDALMDRLISIKLDHFDRETEIRITINKSGISVKEAEVIVDIVRELRQFGVNNNQPTIRACISIASVLTQNKCNVGKNNEFFKQICMDILNSNSIKVTRDGKSMMNEKIEEALKKICK